MEVLSSAPLSRRAVDTPRSVENALKAGSPPRWMERLNQIERGIRREKARLALAYDVLRRETAGDPEAFARRWEAQARAADYSALNELIRFHNEWHPVERDLPMDPRTRDYVPIMGRSHRRAELTPEWILAHFPAR